MDTIKFELDIKGINTQVAILKEIVNGNIRFFVAFSNHLIQDSMNLIIKNGRWTYAPLTDEEIAINILFNKNFPLNYSSYPCLLSQNEIDNIGKEIVNHFDMSLV